MKREVKSDKKKKRRRREREIYSEPKSATRGWHIALESFPGDRSEREGMMENDRKDDRKDDTDERRKGNGLRERKTVSVDGRLLRPCVLVRFLSIRRLTAAERDLHTKNGSARE